MPPVSRPSCWVSRPHPCFTTTLVEIGTSAAETLMIGDDIHIDIVGAQALDIRGVLVKSCKFRPKDLTIGIQSAAVIESFADLPDIWQIDL